MTSTSPRTATSPSVSPKKIRIKILNPVPGGNDSTSLQHAERHVRRGRARFEHGCLFFLSNTESRIVSEEILLLRQQCANYDHIERPMTLNEIAHIPVVMPEKLMIDYSRGRHARN